MVLVVFLHRARVLWWRWFFQQASNEKKSVKVVFMVEVSFSKWANTEVSSLDS